MDDPPAVPTREECVRNLRTVAAGVLTRLAVAEAEGRLTPAEAVVVARMRAKYATQAETQQAS
jgi:hypothetical protein